VTAENPDGQSNILRGNATKVSERFILLDGRLEISNNRAERTIRPFVMGRKKLAFLQYSQRCTCQCDLLQLNRVGKRKWSEPI
jgi:hypothetical protein